MGAFYFPLQLPMALLGPIISPAMGSQLKMIRFYSLPKLMVSSLGPLFLHRNVAGAIGWAILLVAAATDGLAWAHYFSARCPRWHRMGPF
jgi:hypothetical protein